MQIFQHYIQYTLMTREQKTLNQDQNDVPLLHI